MSASTIFTNTRDNMTDDRSGADRPTSADPAGPTSQVAAALPEQAATFNEYSAAHLETLTRSAAENTSAISSMRFAETKTLREIAQLKAQVSHLEAILHDQRVGRNIMSREQDQAAARLMDLAHVVSRVERTVEANQRHIEDLAGRVQGGAEASSDDEFREMRAQIIRLTGSLAEAQRENDELRKAGTEAAYSPPVDDDAAMPYLGTSAPFVTIWSRDSAVETASESRLINDLCDEVMSELRGASSDAEAADAVRRGLAIALIEIDPDNMRATILDMTLDLRARTAQGVEQRAEIDNLCAENARLRAELGGEAA